MDQVIPHKWADFDVAVSGETGEVYHVYKSRKKEPRHVYTNDLRTNRLMRFHFTTSAARPEEYEFGIRSLPNYNPSIDAKLVLADALNLGLLRLPPSEEE